MTFEKNRFLGSIETILCFFTWLIMWLFTIIHEISTKNHDFWSKKIPTIIVDDFSKWFFIIKSWWINQNHDFLKITNNQKDQSWFFKLIIHWFLVIENRVVKNHRALRMIDHRVEIMIIHMKKHKFFPRIFSMIMKWFFMINLRSCEIIKKHVDYPWLFELFCISKFNWFFTFIWTIPHITIKGHSLFIHRLESYSNQNQCWVFTNNVDDSFSSNSILIITSYHNTIVYEK